MTWSDLTKSGNFAKAMDQPASLTSKAVTERVVTARREWRHLHVQVLVEPSNVGPKMVLSPPQTQVLLQLSGEIDLRLDTDGRERRYRTGPGTLYLTPAHRSDYEMEWRTLSPAPVSFLEICLDNDLLAQTAAADAGMDAARLELRDDSALDDPLLGELCRAIGRDLDRPESHSQLYVDTAARMLAMQLVRRHGTVRPLERVPRPALLPPRTLRRVQDHVRAHLKEGLTLEQLAAVAGLSPYYFCRLFRRTTGHSPNSYVIGQRLAYAAYLLRCKRLPTAQAADEVGYANVRHFTLLFRRRFGCSPKAWSENQLYG